ncbi:MAG: HNH endonuclease, partial [Candidatus Thiodiazotropha sp. (ex Lucinoma kastoroae)]|nr:HNH endonuclease [Candidatus Thiodiazotropha sp. (ex Lucinoma kastoroae)]
RREAAKRTRESRKQNACLQPCGETKWGTQLPRTGKFDGERGNSKWTSEDGQYSMDYKEGYPDFKTATTPDGRPAVLREVEIPQKGDYNTDFKAANYEAGYDKTPKGYTWHHKEDGVIMQLVDKKVHDRALNTGSGAAHTGGASIVKDPQF